MNNTEKLHEIIDLLTKLPDVDSGEITDLYTSLPDRIPYWAERVRKGINIEVKPAIIARVFYISSTSKELTIDEIAVKQFTVDVNGKITCNGPPNLFTAWQVLAQIPSLQEDLLREIKKAASNREELLAMMQSIQKALVVPLMQERLK